MGTFGDLIPHRSFKGRLIHKLAKPIMMNAMSYMDGALDGIIEEKQKNGWVNPEVKILFDIFTEIMERDEVCRLPNEQYDPIRGFMTNLRNVTCTVLDEDSHYLLRLFYFIELVNERYPDFRIEMHKKRAYWDWENIYANLLKEREKAKQGLKPDIPITVIQQHPERFPEMQMQLYKQEKNFNEMVRNTTEEKGL